MPLGITAGNSPVDRSVKPWGASAPANGSVYEVFTANMKKVLVWKPDPGTSPNLTHWCHGHALDTYSDHGYTLFSGEHVWQVLKDEYRLIGLMELQPGDVVSFSKLDGCVDHSCKYVSSPITGARTMDNIMVSSKNGASPVVTVPLSQVRAKYANSRTICFWRMVG